MGLFKGSSTNKKNIGASFYPQAICHTTGKHQKAKKLTNKNNGTWFQT
jgi:hypothetical protein